MFHCLDEFSVEIPLKNLNNIYRGFFENGSDNVDNVLDELTYLGKVESDHYVYSKNKNTISLFNTYQENAIRIVKINSEIDKNFELHDKITYNLNKFITIKKLIMLNSKVEMNFNYQEDKHPRHLEEQKLLGESFKHYKNELVNLILEMSC